MGQLIELWETFLLQMDTEEEAPLKGQPASDQPAAAEHAQPEGQLGEGEPQEAAAPATATDVALEQDA
jgi:hypothetical protein